MEIESEVSILVVDDEDDWQELLRTVLEKEGYRVIATKSPRSARDLLATTKFALAIFDMRLTDSSYDVQGLALAKEAKILCPSIKALLLTGYPDPDQQDKALHVYKADGYYEKAPGGRPLRVDDLRRIVRELLA